MRAEIVLPKDWSRRCSRIAGLPFLAAALLVSACSKPIEPQGCDVCTTSGIVEGKITYADGSPVVGVPLDVRAFRDACPADTARPSAGGTDAGRPLTQADGSYEARPISLFGPFTAHCFVLTLNTSGDPRWPGPVSAEFGGALEFGPDDGGTDHDRLHIDWALARNGPS